MNKDDIIEKFPWGDVEQLHEIGEYFIIEYRPYIYENGRGTKKLHDYTEFHPYLDGRGGYTYRSLDAALIGVISRKYKNHNAAPLIERMLEMKP